MSKFIPQGLGWIPDLPDPRDFTHEHPKILSLLERLRPFGNTLPDSVDLRHGEEGEVFLTDVEDQGNVNSSTAFAVLSMVEYFERRIHAHTFDGSTLFLYKVARNLRNKRYRVTGDTGADLRTTLKALCKFGFSSNELWPYDVEQFDEEPPAFVYQAARPVPGLYYFRLDSRSMHPSTEQHQRPSQMNLVNSFLAAGFPVAFG